MKKTLTILAAIIAAFCGAAVSPLTGSDFRLTSVNTNLISGRLMGDTGDYALMRYEDIAFLNEAFRERYMLLSGLFARGNSFDSFTNSRDTVESTIKEQTIHDSGVALVFGMSPSISEDRTIKFVGSGFPMYTNVVENVFWRPSEFVTTTNIVRQTLTNGNEDASIDFLNTYLFLTNITVLTVSTNVYNYAVRAIIDRDLSALTVPNMLWKRQYDNSNLMLRQGAVYSATLVTNAYSLLKDLHITIPRVTDGIYSTNYCEFVSRSSGYSSDSGHWSNPDIRSRSYGFSYSVTGSYYSEDKRIDERYTSYGPNDGLWIIFDVGVAKKAIPYFGTIERCYAALEFVLSVEETSGTNHTYHTVRGYLPVDPNVVDIYQEDRVCYEARVVNFISFLDLVASNTGLRSYHYGDAAPTGQLGDRIYGSYSVHAYANVVYFLDLKPRTSLPGWPPQ